jgi:spermidine synthase
MDWYDETLYADVHQGFAVARIIHREKTEHQDLVIFENSRMGRVLALDGVIQTTEGDEFFYHEMMSHVPLFAHGKAERVLIIGGGDGGLLEEALKHPDVKRVVMVEIDPHVIELSRRFLPGISGGAFDDARTELVIADGARYAAETAERFDVVMVDSTDPHGPGEVLFTAAFYADCHRCLGEGGIMVTQNGVPFFQPDELKTSWSRLKPIFADVAFYIVPVPTYYGGFMTLGWAAKSALPRAAALEELAKRYARSGMTTRYYNPETHRAAFALPNYIRAPLA